jgi:RND family efflux transporter MFP subunit
MSLPRIIAGNLALAAVLLLLNGCGKQNANAAPGPRGFPVKIQIAKAQLVPDSTDYLAALKSRNAAELHPQVEGDITAIFVHAGAQVQAGTPVLQIDSRKQEATVSNQVATYKSKLATVELNRVDLERKKKLYEAGVIAKADLDVSQAAFDTSKSDADALDAAIREQREQLRYYTVKATTVGVIGDIPVHVGDHVTNATILTTVDRGGPLEAYINIPAEKSAQVKSGIKVEILDETGQTLLRTQISFISPHMDTATQTLLVKAPAPNLNHKFLNEQQVHARVIWSEHQAPLIPVTAVSRMSGKMFAFVVDGQGQQTVARQRIINVGDLIGNDYVVLDGIQPGDRIIVSGVQILADGMPVIPQS